MTKTEFISECGERFIDVFVALENEKIVDALKNRDDERLRELLNTEF